MLNGLDHLVLLAVHRNVAIAGLDIICAEVERATRREIGRSSVYQAIQRLEERGWLKETEDVRLFRRRGKGRPIKRYRLTDDGRAELERSAAAMQALRRSS